MHSFDPLFFIKGQLCICFYCFFLLTLMFHDMGMTVVIEEQEGNTHFFLPVQVMIHTVDINQLFLFPGLSAVGSQESQQVTGALW